MSYKYEMRKAGVAAIDWRVNDITITCDCDGDHFEVELEGHVDKRAIDIGDFELIKDHIQNRLNGKRDIYDFDTRTMYPSHFMIDTDFNSYVKNDVDITKRMYKLMLNSVYGAHSQHQLTKLVYPCEIRKVIFNDPATVVMWSDGTKTVVKCQEGDIFDPEKGLAMAISKKAFGNTGSYCDEIKKWTEKYDEECKRAYHTAIENIFNDITIPNLSDAIKQVCEQIKKAKEVK